MPIQFVSDDLFLNRHKAVSLAHGCNCAGSMGAGIAVSFKARFPAIFEEYRRRCKATPPEFTLGSIFLWTEPGQPAVFNLGTQLRPGRGATYPVLETVLKLMRDEADEKEIGSIAVPRIAAGYGGLSWKKVRTIIETVFSDWPGTLFVYEEYRPDE